LKVRFLGAHTTESRNTKLSGLLIDDVLALDVGGLTSSLTFTEQLKLKAVLITHQHYDHIRDMPALGMTLFLNNVTIDVYSLPSVRDALACHLLNGDIYPDFFKATIHFHPVEPYRETKLEGYSVLPLPLEHSVPAVGYQVTSADGKKLFYTGDAGPGMAHCWQHCSPQLLVVEVTTSDRYQDFGREAGHLTPNLLKEELISFQKIRGYLPRVITVHMNPALEAEIKAELAGVSGELGASISLASEGRQLSL
jgi:ribonuclease BN (tRNA processing enzyme)